MIITLLLALLMPAAVYITSPWWAASACNRAAAGLWDMDLKLATASLNPFRMCLEGAGGTFATAAGRKLRASGDVSRIRVSLNPLDAFRRHRIREVRLEVGMISVALSDAGDLAPMSGCPPAPPPVPLLLAGVMGAPEGPWIIDRLRLKVERGILRYDNKGRKGEVSMDLGFSAVLENVSDLSDVSRKVLHEILAKAAYSFLAEKLLR